MVTVSMLIRGYAFRMFYILVYRAEEPNFRGCWMSGHTHPQPAHKCNHYEEMATECHMFVCGTGALGSLVPADVRILCATHIYTPAPKYPQTNATFLRPHAATGNSDKKQVRKCDAAQKGRQSEEEHSLNHLHMRIKHHKEA